MTNRVGVACKTSACAVSHRSTAITPVARMYIFLFAAVETKIHSCEKKSERCRDEAKILHSQKYNSYFVQRIYTRMYLQGDYQCWVLVFCVSIEDVRAILKGVLDSLQWLVEGFLL